MNRAWGSLEWLAVVKSDAMATAGKKSLEGMMSRFQTLVALAEVAPILTAHAGPIGDKATFDHAQVVRLLPYSSWREGGEPAR